MAKPRKKYKAQDIEQALRKKGFDVRQSHHRILTLMVNGRRSRIHTRLSHSSPAYTDTLLSLVRRQLGRLSPQEFQDLVDCPMSYDTYLALLRGRSIVL